VNKSTITFIFIIGIFLFGCTNIRVIPEEEKPIELEFDELKSTLNTCVGTGKLVASGAFSGRLVFQFASKNDSTYLLFTDLLGRRTMYMQLYNENSNIWDMKNNLRYSYDFFVDQFPAMRLLTPLDLTKVLWGASPFIDSVDSTRNSELKSQHISVHFNSEISQFGSIITGLELQDHNANQNITLEITNREYGVWNPSLVRSIPSSVKWNE